MFSCCLGPCHNPCHVNKLVFFITFHSRDNLLPLHKNINLTYTIKNYFTEDLEIQFKKLNKLVYHTIIKYIPNCKIIIQGYNYDTKHWQSIPKLLEYIFLLNVDYCKKCGKQYIKFVYPKYQMNLRVCREEYSHLLYDKVNLKTQ